MLERTPKVLHVPVLHVRGEYLKNLRPIRQESKVPVQPPSFQSDGFSEQALSYSAFFVCAVKLTPQ